VFSKIPSTTSLCEGFIGTYRQERLSECCFWLHIVIGPLKEKKEFEK